MSALKCKKCGEIAAYVIPKDKLQEAYGSDSLGTAGTMNAVNLERLFDIVLDIIERVLDWFTKEDEKYVVCKNCGYYEKL